MFFLNFVEFIQLNWQNILNYIFKLCLILGFYPFVNAAQEASPRTTEVSKNLQQLGNAKLSIWSHLTEFELLTVNNISKARLGDADALLMLYLTASGNSRSMSAYQLRLRSINQFVEKITPEIDNAGSEWRKGYILLQAMHRHFFVGGDSNSNTSKGYDFDQSQLSEIFESKKFNCISSSLLYIILARKFDLKVSGVLLPSHAFVQIELKDGKILEVETTSSNGYDWVHNQEFYQKSNTSWFQSRGLSPSTFKDYQNRKIVSPVMLGADNMTHQHTNSQRMRKKDRVRMVELLSSLSPLNLKAHKARLYFYNNEFVRLNKLKDYQSLSRMYLHISPFIDFVKISNGNDSEVARMAAWIGSQMAFVSWQNGDSDIALALARKTLSEVSELDKDREKIIENIYVTLNNISQKYTNQKQFKKSLQVYQGEHRLCISSKRCRDAVRYLYSKWAANDWDKQQWSQVIARYNEYLGWDWQGEIMRPFKENLQSAYLNWANQFAEKGDWLEVNKILNLCISNDFSIDKCQQRLKQLQANHRLE